MYSSAGPEQSCLIREDSGRIRDGHEVVDTLYLAIHIADTQKLVRIFRRRNIGEQGRVLFRCLVQPVRETFSASDSRTTLASAAVAAADNLASVCDSLRSLVVC